MSINIKKLKNLIILIVAFFLFSFLFVPYSLGSSPQFLASWQTNSYAPSWYQGKVFPTFGSLIEINFELIDNNKIVDLSKNKIRWHINNRLIKNETDGLGIKFLKFTNNNLIGRNIEIKITIVDYGDQPLFKIIRIPVVAPKTIIDAPHPKRKIGVGENLFRALPFFFNIKNLDKLSFEWQADKQTSNITENPQELNLNIDARTLPGTTIRIRAIIKNIANQLEFASENIKIEIK